MDELIQAMVAFCNAGVEFFKAHTPQPQPQVQEQTKAPVQTTFTFDKPSTAFMDSFGWGFSGFSTKSHARIKNVIRAFKHLAPTITEEGHTNASNVSRSLGFGLGTTEYQGILEAIKKLHKNGVLDKHPTKKVFKLSERALSCYDLCGEMWNAQSIPSATQEVDSGAIQAAGEVAQASDGGNAGQVQGQQDQYVCSSSEQDVGVWAT
jgi:hypothetical protein